MIKSKTSMILAVLVLLFAAICLSGCLGGNDNNVTPPEPSENITPPINETPSENVTPPVVEPTEKVSISKTYDGDDSLLITIKNKRYSSTSVNIGTGDTVRIWSREERNFRHIFHSEENAFEDFDIIPGYFVYMTFNEAGTYKIDMINYYTGEPYGDSPIVLTVKVA